MNKQTRRFDRATENPHVAEVKRIARREEQRKAIYAFIDEQCQKAAREWHAIQFRDPYAAVYLYHKLGELTAAKETPPGFALSDGRRLPPGNTIAQTAQHINSLTGRLPILPPHLTQ